MDIVNEILLDGIYGNSVKIFHSTGASIVLVFVYLHISRALRRFNISRVVTGVVKSGVIILLLLFAVCFVGYILPWGSMSYWALTVITNLSSVIPYVGSSFVEFLWGGLWVSSSTIQRFFLLHWSLPLLVVILVSVHLTSAHRTGSSRPSGLLSGVSHLDTFGVYWFKDCPIAVLVIGLFLVLVCSFPDSLSHPDNCNIVDRFTTPAHIVPEWYFLPWYAILRAVTIKIFGVILLCLMVAVLGFAYHVGSGSVILGSFIANSEFICHITLLLLLGCLGSCSPTYPFTEVSVFFTLFSILLVKTICWFLFV